MSSSNQDNEFDRLYQHHVAARRQLESHYTLRGKLQQGTTLISVIVVLVSIAYRFYGRGSDDASFFSFLWDALVYILPARLIFTLDDWKNPTEVRQMNGTLHEAKSDALRRVFQVDGEGGILASVFKARTQAVSVTENALGLKPDKRRPAGLGNYDNSCYQNSILQGLSALGSMPEFLTKAMRTMRITDDGRLVTQNLLALIANLNDIYNNGQTLWTPRILKSMSTWTQQDAQEYYSKILDDIDKGISRAVKRKTPRRGFEGKRPPPRPFGRLGPRHGPKPTGDLFEGPENERAYHHEAVSTQLDDLKLLRNPLEGLLAQRVACTQCGFSEGLSMIPFNCLTLSLDLEQSQYDIYDRLDAYTKVEEIDGVECPKCTLLKAKRLLNKLVEQMREKDTPEAQLVEPLRRLEAVDLALEEDDFKDETIRDDCKITSQSTVSSTKTKQIVVARPPQSLVVHMNRSVFDPSTFNMIKNSAPVRFPLSLDLGPWCLGSSNAFGPKNTIDGTKDEQWHMGPRSSMVASESGPSRMSGPIYELKAAVTHYGRHDNGHYICYRKYPKAPESAAEPTTAQEEEDDIDDSDSDGDNDEEGNSDSDDGIIPPRDDAWWRLSDHNVSEVSEDVITGLAPGVFMLFYECVDPEMVLDPDDEQDGAEAAADVAEDGSAVETQPGTNATPDQVEDTSSVASSTVSTSATTVDTDAETASQVTVTTLEDDNASEKDVKASP